MAAPYRAINPFPRQEINDSFYEPCPNFDHQPLVWITHHRVREQEAEHCPRCGRRFGEWQPIGNR